jgi:hypothetical protein
VKTNLAYLLLFLLLGSSACAQVLPNDAVVDGKTIGDWSAEWWKWILPASTNQNPDLDTDGAFASIGQPTGSVFLIAWDLGIMPGPFIRHFTVPEGKYLFFPVATFEADNVDSCPPCYSVPELRDQAKAVVDVATDLHADIDGVEITNILEHRTVSPVFSLLYTNADNLHTVAFPHPITGLIDPMVCDGYWLMLEPLPPGPHVLRFGGTFPGLFFPADVVDYITVVPISPSETLAELKTAVTGAQLSPTRCQPLLVSLDAAKVSFESENYVAGINQLRAFQNKVRAQLSSTDGAFAAKLIGAAQEIIDKAGNQSKVK